MKKLRVLVIDDSAFNRKTIAEILDQHPEIDVVGKAFDGEEGLKLATQLKPDLITLDIEMPRMDGFTFLRILMHQLPTPVIVISSHSRKEEVFQALELGALDFIAKPTHHIAPDLASLQDDLINKVLTVRALQALPFQRAHRVLEPSGDVRSVASLDVGAHPDRVVCIGASTGGPPALESVFKALPIFPSTAFLVVQHMPEKFTRAFAERLNRLVEMRIVEAEAGMPIRGGSAYVAPGGSHVFVDHGDDGPVLLLTEPESVDRYVPSIDKLFCSATTLFGESTLGVVLTGMGSDGSEGVRAVCEAGGLTIAESKESSVVFGMPKEAIETGCVTHVLPLGDVVDQIRAFATQPRKGA